MRIYDLRAGLKPDSTIKGQIYQVTRIDKQEGYDLSLLLDTGYDIRLSEREIEYIQKEASV